MNRIPTRPSLLKAIIIVGLATLLGILPPTLLPFLDWAGVPNMLPERMPSWAEMILPILGIMLVGGYAIFLQHFDRREYQKIFSLWSPMARNYEFEPLSEILLKRSSDCEKNVVERARKLGQFAFKKEDAGSFQISLDAHIIEKFDRDIVRVEAGKIFVHPDLVITEHRAQPGKGGNGEHRAADERPT